MTSKSAERGKLNEGKAFGKKLCSRGQARSEYYADRPCGRTGTAMWFCIKILKSSNLISSEASTKVLPMRTT